MGIFGGGKRLWVIRLKLTAFFPSAELPVEVAAEEDEDEGEDHQGADHSDPQIVDNDVHVGVPEDLVPPGGLRRILGSVSQIGKVQNHRFGELLGADAAVWGPTAGRSRIVGHRRVANPLEQCIKGVEGIDVPQVVGTGYLEGDLILLQVLGNRSRTHAAGRGGYVLRVQLLGGGGGLHQWVIRGANHGDFFDSISTTFRLFGSGTRTQLLALASRHVNKSHGSIYKSWVRFRVFVDYGYSSILGASVRWSGYKLTDCLLAECNTYIESLRIPWLGGNFIPLTSSSHSLLSESWARHSRNQVKSLVKEACNFWHVFYVFKCLASFSLFVLAS